MGLIGENLKEPPTRELISNPQATTKALQQQKATPWEDYQRIAFDDKDAMSNPKETHVS